MTTIPTDFLDPLGTENRSALNAYLSFALSREVSGIADGPSRLTGGIENRNYRVTVDVDGKPKSFALRMPPEEIPKWRRGDDPSDPGDRYDLGREFRLLRAIGPLSLKSPRAFGFDGDGRFFGVPCFVMEYLPGQSLYGHFYAKDGPLNPECDASLMRMYARQVAAISQTPYEQDAFLANDLPRWTLERMDAWMAYRARDRMSDPLIAYAMDWLAERRPSPQPLCLAHGDPNPTNILTDDGRITGVVDWEFACLIDHPAFALAVFFCGYYEPLLWRGLADGFCEAMAIDKAELDWFITRGMLVDAIEGMPITPQRQQQRREQLAQRTAFSQ